MTRPLTCLTVVAMGFALLRSEESALADDAGSAAVQRANNTALVFFKPGITQEQRNSIFDDANLKIEMSFVEDRDKEQDWTVVNLAPDLARDYILEKYGDVARVQRNSVFYSFGDPCNGSTATNLPSGRETPPGITTMGAPLKGSPSARKVWVIDSGVDPASNLQIDYDNAANCMPSGSKCKTAGNPHNDRVIDDCGHGTFVAGIIGGKDVGNGSILGIAPGATIVPLKVSNKVNNTPNADAMIRAMKWLLNADGDHQAAAKGDVVNISFGSLVDFQSLIEDGSSPYTEFETYVIALADKGVKVVTAAGNFSPSDATAETGGYVELLSPARLGGYRPASGGAIVTVSAIDTNDKFWSGSFFGNGIRPDYAAPGVDIQSLWLNSKQNRQTGTSFSAPHVAGVLLQSEDIDLVVTSPNIQDVDGENDKVATCKQPSDCNIQ